MSLIWSLLLLLVSGGLFNLNAANVVVIGDSLSAEYEAIPDFPGTENPTEYARVTVNGWESMSWVEVLGRLRGEAFNLGRYKSDLLGWLDLRFSGYENNFAIPGFRAAHYEDIVNSSLFSNPQYLPFRSSLQDALRSADRVVIWLGANEFRAEYGFLAGGGDPASLIRNLIEDLRDVVDFVRAQRSSLQIVLANIPDLGAAPDKRKAYPDAGKRALATAATKQANAAIASLAASKGIPVADMFAQTERLISGATSYFGAVEIINDIHPDNHPRYHFTREGLHPNTPTQIETARVIIETFNAAFKAGIPQISDREALTLLGISADQPYQDWIAPFGVAAKGMQDDPDGDGLVNLIELAFGLDPSKPSQWPVLLTAGQERLSLRFFPDGRFRRLVKVVPQQSSDLRIWTDLPESEITTGPDGTTVASLRLGSGSGFMRLRIALLLPE